MSDHNLRLLLYAIQNDADASRLRRHGLEYSQIAVLIDEAIESEFVSIAGETLSVTPNGLELLQRKSLFQGKKRPTIEPEEESRMEKQSVTDIYLPPSKESYFEP